MPAAQARMPGRGLSGLYVSKTVSGSAKLAIHERGARMDHHPPSIKVDELWVILDKGAQVQLGEEVLEPETGEKIFIPRGTVHRLSTAGESEVRILEISFGEFDEEDIVRLDDVYGRVVH